jgi:hypothetical protein
VSDSTPRHGHHPTISTPSPEEISSKDIFNALKESVLLHFGDVGWGDVGASLAGESFFNFNFFFSFYDPRVSKRNGARLTFFSPIFRLSLLPGWDQSSTFPL